MISPTEIPSWVSASAMALENPGMKTSNPTPRSVWVWGSKKISALRTPSAWALAR